MAFLPKTSGVALLFLVIVACAAATADLKPSNEAKTAAADKSDSPKIVVSESHPNKESGSSLSHDVTPTETKILHTDVTNITPEPTLSPNVTTTTTTLAPKPPTTSSPNVTTTTPAPQPTTSSPNVTTTTPAPQPTTSSPNVTSTTPAPQPTTVSPNVTTTTPAPAPAPQRNWSAPSFFGGMVLAFGIVAVGFVGYRFFYVRNGGAYHTL